MLPFNWVAIFRKGRYSSLSASVSLSTSFSSLEDRTLRMTINRMIVPKPAAILTQILRFFTEFLLSYGQLFPAWHGQYGGFFRGRNGILVLKLTQDVANLLLTAL